MMKLSGDDVIVSIPQRTVSLPAQVAVINGLPETVPSLVLNIPPSQITASPGEAATAIGQQVITVPARVITTSNGRPAQVPVQYVTVDGGAVTVTDTEIQEVTPPSIVDVSNERPITPTVPVNTNALAPVATPVMTSAPAFDLSMLLKPPYLYVGLAIVAFIIYRKMRNG